MMPVTDTSSAADAKQFELYRSLSPSERVRIALNLSEMIRRTTIAGIRRRHPEYDDAEVVEALRELVYGRR